MRASRLRIVVTGLLAQYPLGGVTWDYLQYVLGLARLGHDVFYLEDTGQWPYNPREQGVSRGCDYNVAYLRTVMERFGLADRWAYRFPWESRWYGLSDERREAVLASADLLLNVSGTLADPAAYRRIPHLAYIDSDPVFTQVKLARGQQDFRALVDLHDVHFSFGECLSAGVPETGHLWQPTRQPIVLDEWAPQEPHRGVFTTVMSWASYNPVTYNGHTYGQKDVEFQRFMDLPGRAAPAPLELAVSQGRRRRVPRSLLVHRGWRVVDPLVVCPDLDTYRDYLASSMAEWSVAKNGYVVGQAGWFSCRSACYLACGRPVIVQDTGFSPVIPHGEGVLAFSTLEEAIEAIREVQANYPRHADAARSVAATYFSSEAVLTALLERAMCAPPVHAAP